MNAKDIGQYVSRLERELESAQSLNNWLGNRYHKVLAERNEARTQRNEDGVAYSQEVAKLKKVIEDLEENLREETQQKINWRKLLEIVERDRNELRARLASKPMEEASAPQAKPMEQASEPETKPIKLWRILVRVGGCPPTYLRPDGLFDPDLKKAMWFATEYAALEYVGCHQALMLLPVLVEQW